MGPETGTPVMLVGLVQVLQGAKERVPERTVWRSRVKAGWPATSTRNPEHANPAGQTSTSCGQGRIDGCPSWLRSVR